MPPNKLKLAYVVKYYHPMRRISGILRFVYDLLGALAPRFEIGVFTYRYAPEAPARQAHRGYEIIRLKAPFPFRGGRAVRRWAPDAVIFGSGFWQPYLLLPYWELFRAGLGKFSGPVALTQYTNMTGRFSSLLRLLRPSPSRVIATTAAIAREWEKIWPGRTVCLPPGVDFSAFTAAAGPAAPRRREVRIGYFGHLQPHKGPDRLLKIFQEINPATAELLIQGEGEMKEELAFRARGWDSIMVQGYLPEVDGWIRSCDVIVLPYRSAVSVLGYSRVALEALAAGIPLVATPTPAVSPLIEEGENGFVCADERDLKEKIRLLIGDKALREKLSSGARRKGAEFDISRIAARYAETIHAWLRVRGAGE